MGARHSSSYGCSSNGGCSNRTPSENGLLLCASMTAKLSCCWGKMMWQLLHLPHSIINATKLLHVSYTQCRTAVSPQLSSLPPTCSSLLIALCASSTNSRLFSLNDTTMASAASSSARAARAAATSAVRKPGELPGSSTVSGS